MMTDSEKQEWTEAARELLTSGKRHLLVSDIPAAVSDLAESSDLFSKVFGESSLECAESFLYYGKSLLAVSRLESGVLGNALQGVDVSSQDDGSVDGQVEDPEKMTKDEQLEVEEKVAEALEVNFEKHEKIAAAHLGEEGSEEEDSAMEEGASQEESEAEGTGDKMETDKSTDNEVESEEEPGNLQLAWEMLELAKNAFTKMRETSAEDRRKEAEVKLGEALLALGEVSLENENYEQSAADLVLCLAIRQKAFPADSRSIAETFYQLGVAQAFGAKYAESEASLNSAIGVLEARVKNLCAMEASDNIGQEIQDLEALVKDVKDKIVDHKDMEKGVYVDKEAAGFAGAGDGKKASSIGKIGRASCRERV